MDSNFNAKLLRRISSGSHYAVAVQLMLELFIDAFVENNKMGFTMQIDNSCGSKDKIIEDIEALGGFSIIKRKNDTVAFILENPENVNYDNLFKSITHHMDEVLPSELRMDSLQKITMILDNRKDFDLVIVKKINDEALSRVIAQLKLDMIKIAKDKAEIHILVDPLNIESYLFNKEDSGYIIRKIKEWAEENEFMIEYHPDTIAGKRDDLFYIKW